MAVYLTPGPSQPHQKLKQFIDNAWAEDIMAISHRGEEFREVYRRTDNALRQLMGIPADYRIMFLSSATEAMERIIQGVVDRRSHHFITGAFAEKWFQIAKQLGKQPTAVRATVGRGLKLSQLKVPKDTELICLTQNETSTGVALPDSFLRKLLGPASQPLVALDVVSSVPLTKLPWAKLDLVFFSVQKAFGLPAGLGVLIASSRALAKAQELRQRRTSTGSYHNLVELAETAADYQTPATPNVLNIYLLGRVCEDMLAQGIDKVRHLTQKRARLLYQAIDSNSHLQPFIKPAEWRSLTVVVVALPQSKKIHQALSQKGIVIGKGYRPFTDEHIRIANFPTIDEQIIKEVISHLKNFSPRD